RRVGGGAHQGVRVGAAVEPMKPSGPGSRLLRDESRNIGLAMEFNLSNVSRWRRQGLSEVHFFKRSLSGVRDRFFRELLTIDRAYFSTKWIDSRNRDRELLHRRTASNSTCGRTTTVTSQVQ